MAQAPMIQWRYCHLKSRVKVLPPANPANHTGDRQVVWSCGDGREWDDELTALNTLGAEGWGCVGFRHDPIGSTYTMAIMTTAKD